MKLRVELEAHNGTTAWAEYDTFRWDFKDWILQNNYWYNRIEGEDQAYLLHIGEYSGTAGDSMIMTGSYGYSNANGMKFTTWDRDNDKASGHCAQQWKGGWWFNK